MDGELLSAKGCYWLVHEFCTLIDKLITLRRAVGICVHKDRLTNAFLFKDLALMVHVWYLAWLGLKSRGPPCDLAKSCTWNMIGIYKTMFALCPTDRWKTLAVPWTRIATQLMKTFVVARGYNLDHIPGFEGMQNIRGSRE